MLGGLVRDDDAIALPQLARPHARAVDDELALDVPGTRAHACHTLQHWPLRRDDALDADALDDPHTEIPGPLGIGHRQVDRVDPTVTGHPEAADEPVHLGERKDFLHLLGRHLVRLQPQAPLEDRGPPVFLHPALVERLDQAAAPEAG